MTKLLNAISSTLLENGCSLFKCPIPEKMPGAIADLLFDPVDRYEHLLERSLNGSTQQAFEEPPPNAAGSPQWSVPAEAMPRTRFTGDKKSLHQRVGTDAASEGQGSSPRWKDPSWAEPQANADRMRSIAEALRATASPLPQAGRFSVVTTIPTHPASARNSANQKALTSSVPHLTAVDLAESAEAGRPSWDAARPVRHIGAAQHLGAERHHVPHVEEVRSPGSNPLPPVERGEDRNASRTEPRATGSALRLAKSFSDIGQILGANLPREESDRMPVRAMTRLEHRRPVSLPEPPRLSSTGSRNILGPSGPDDIGVRAPLMQPKEDSEAIFEELEERLRLEYLRMYGTSGGL